MEAQKDPDGMAAYLEKKARYKQGIVKAMEGYNERVKNMPEEDRRFDERQAWREINKAKGIVMDKTSEWQEQKIVCDWLDLRGHAYFAVPNRLVDGSTKSGRIRGHQAKMIGLKAGVPDLIIITQIDYMGHRAPTAIEMKKEGAGIKSLSPHQEKWAAKFVDAGWHWVLGEGATQTIRCLERMGY